MDISLIIPVYNEVESLPALYEQLSEVLKPWKRKYEILFIDDGSDDGTYEVIADLHKQDKRVKVIQFRKNYGKSAALAVGFDAAEGDIFIMMDADLQDDPYEIPKFLKKLEEGYDFVNGWKYPRLDPLNKTLPSRLFNFTMRTATRINIHDFNCGFKAMRSEVADEITLYGELHRQIPVLAAWRGFKVTEVKVKHHPRQFGKSKFGFQRYYRGLFDFVTVYFLTQYTSRPMHFFGGFGLLSFGAGMIISLYMTYLRFSGEIIGTRPLLTLGVLLLIIGAQFLFFGLLAEMVSADRFSKELDYSIKNKLD
ncbi:MAG: glycosyltransferase [Chloroflexi bacterium]|nr:MAG: glycosyltransferase [Chloroflexota bacterium]MBL1193203.1 glycosyltransferase [Chloroflexota bacterium]NOH10497.1 glycosyltransferase family 2 protein [Chloroflexota bacterium]